ncbi:MAG: Tyrosine recombinase XerD [candidate division TM6 bacterium GW2011_GWF2_28_16]|nr:MAG: Tyrosine recombinase XerD [candidate division TM6 bacterium GW2011_GWF2_28_16]
MADNLGDTDFLVSFTTYLLTEKRTSKNTFVAYKKDCEQLLDFLKDKKVNIRICNKQHLKNFLKKLKDDGVSAKTISRKISCLKSFFNFLNERFNIANKAGELVFPKLEQTLPNFLLEDEIEELLKVAGKDSSDKGVRNRVMLSLLYASGMRVSELVNLKTDQIDFDTGFVTLLGKGNKERMVPVPTAIFEFLRFYLEKVYENLKPKSEREKINNNNYLFFTYYNNSLKPISRQSFWGILKNILQKTNIKKKVSPHTLRHSLATHLLKSGANIRSLQLLLGHENISTVQIYTHLEKSHVREIYDDKHPRA